MSENEQTVELPPIKVAFVIDGEVVDVLHTDERLASIFLSNPTIINVTGEDGDQIAHVTDLYDATTHTFTPKTQELNLVNQYTGPEYKDWVWDNVLGHSVPPIPYPNEDGKKYDWDFTTKNWVEVTD